MSALAIFGIICVQTLDRSNLELGPPLKLLEGLRAALEILDTVGKGTRVVRRCSKYLKKWITISSVLGKFSPDKRRHDIADIVDFGSSEKLCQLRYYHSDL